MTIVRWFFLLVMTTSIVVDMAGVSDAQSSNESVEFFEARIRPVLVEKCYPCHSVEAGKSEGGLYLDSRTGIRAGGESGTAIQPGNSQDSLLASRIADRSDDDRMPPPEFGERLSADVVADFLSWIDQGAADPREGTKPPPARDMESAANHWAFQPLVKPPLPNVPAANASLSALDQFVATKQSELKIAMNPPADRRTLLRRLSYDLTGLPPTYTEVLDFERDSSSHAYEKVVERLLNSPAYGQRWARFWLDVARYADTKGYLAGGQQQRFSFSYTYRDYVIDSFNNDKPFQNFIVEQLAADQLDLTEDRRPLAALGFLTLGRRFLNNQDDIIDDRIDVTSRGMLGLTVGCARCHDHKFDPIPTEDYYSFHGVFASSQEPDELPLLGEVMDTASYQEFLSAQEEVLSRIDAKSNELIDAFLARHQALEAEYVAAAAAFKGMAPSPDLDKFAGERKLSGPFLQRWIDAVRDPLHPERDEVANWIRRDINEKTAKFKQELEALNWKHVGAPKRAMALVDRDRPRDSRVLLRGKRGNEGPVAPRQFLEALSPAGREPFQHGSGRLELAQAIARHPLAARVFVNRVWGWHFGTPLVTTQSDFGVRTPPPLLADALEWLAADFIEYGGSIKHLHRQIVLSKVYMQSSTRNMAALQLDPENSALHSMTPRRLEFEAMRDTLLAVTGKLDLSHHGLPIVLTDSPTPVRRAVYGFIDRQNLPGVFRTFDFPNPDATTPGRFRTTVPQQALYLMNSSFALEQADSLAQQIEGFPAEHAIVQLYQRLFQRRPTDAEISLGTAYLNGADLAKRSRYCHALMLSNELMFVD
ncbi:MAG: PSD1 domain-containing protein [Planctomycetales bacterium]|nr:PSD1 domain-containing protein [Planctomycetales bacterium]